MTYCRRGGLPQGLNLGALNVETDRRGFIPVDDHMRVLGKDGKAVPHLWAIGDANGAWLACVCVLVEGGGLHDRCLRAQSQAVCTPL